MPAAPSCRPANVATAAAAAASTRVRLRLRLRRDSLLRLRLVRRAAWRAPRVASRTAFFAATLAALAAACRGQTDKQEGDEDNGLC